MAGRSIIVLSALLAAIAPARAEVVLTSGADAFIDGRTVGGTFGRQPYLDVRNIGTAPDDISYARKTYIAFDTTGHPEAVHQAVLRLRVLSGEGKDAPPARDWNFAVYGLLKTQPSWNENTLTWNNAPGHYINSPTRFRAGATYGGKPLGTFAIHGMGEEGSIVEFLAAAGEPLVDFINSNSSGMLTLVIVRETAGDMIDDGIHRFASREYVPAGGAAGDWAPQLILAPEPGTLATICIGAWLISCHRKRRRR